MGLRWCTAGLAETQKQFRRVNGHLHLPPSAHARRVRRQHRHTPTTTTADVARALVRCHRGGTARPLVPRHGRRRLRHGLRRAARRRLRELRPVRGERYRMADRDWSVLERLDEVGRREFQVDLLGPDRSTHHGGCARTKATAALAKPRLNSALCAATQSSASVTGVAQRFPSTSPASGPLTAPVTSAWTLGTPSKRSILCRSTWLWPPSPGSRTRTTSTQPSNPSGMSPPARPPSRRSR
jgi:hypothetical protein